MAKLLAEVQLHEISIKTDTPFTTVFVDGKQLKGIQSVDYHAEIDGLPTVTIKVLPCKVTIDGKCVVNLEDKCEKACPKSKKILVGTDARLKRDGKIYEVVCADENTFVLAEANGSHVSYDHLGAYSNNPNINSLKDLHFERIE